MLHESLVFVNPLAYPINKPFVSLWSISSENNIVWIGLKIINFQRHNPSRLIFSLNSANTFAFICLTLSGVILMSLAILETGNA